MAIGKFYWTSPLEISILNENNHWNCPSEICMRILIGNVCRTAPSDISIRNLHSKSPLAISTGNVRWKYPFELSTAVILRVGNGHQKSPSEMCIGNPKCKSPLEIFFGNLDWKSLHWKSPLKISIAKILPISKPKGHIHQHPHSNY